MEFKCGNMTINGCEAMQLKKTLKIDVDNEPCNRECCIDCTEICGVRCMRAKWPESERIITPLQEEERKAGLRCWDCYKELGENYREVRNNNNGMWMFFCYSCYNKKFGFKEDGEINLFNFL